MNGQIHYTVLIMFIKTKLTARFFYLKLCRGTLFRGTIILKIEPLLICKRQPRFVGKEEIMDEYTNIMRRQIQRHNDEWETRRMIESIFDERSSKISDDVLQKMD